MSRIWFFAAAVILAVLSTSCSSQSGSLAPSPDSGLRPAIQPSSSLPDLADLGQASPRGSSASIEYPYPPREVPGTVLSRYGGTIDIQNEALRLQPDAGGIAWSMYSIPAGYNESRDSGYVVLNIEPVGQQTVYVGFSNFDRGAWEWRAVNLDTSLTQHVQLDLQTGVDYSAAQDFQEILYMVVLASDGKDCLVHQIDYYVNQKNADLQDLTASQAQASNSITLDWQPVDGALFYYVIVDDPSENNGPNPFFKVNTGTSFTHNALSVGDLPMYPGWTYDYTVYAVYPDGLLSHLAQTVGTTAP